MGYPVTEKYSRPGAPELASGKAYDPFETFGKWATVFLVLKYGNVYFYSVFLFASWPSASQSTIPKVDEGPGGYD